MIRASHPLRRTAFAAFALTLALSLAGAGVAQARPRMVTIAQARTLPLGTVVTVTGSVSTPSGVFNSSFFDQGFGLQDGNAGIFISLQTNLGVAPRAQARVTARSPVGSSREN
jgi:hypothetical protein